MIGELIPTGVTFSTGRHSINNAFSGTGSFNILTANTLSASTFFSGSTPLSMLITGGSSASIWSASTGINSIIANNGTGNKASGDFSFAGGSGSTALSAFSYSFGEGTISEGLFSYANGGYCLTNGYASHAEGIGCTASTTGFAFGWFSTATEGGIVFGIGSIAIGNYAHVVGITNTAYGYNSIAMGEGNIASGRSAVVLGQNSKTGNDNAFASGYAASAMSINSFVHSKNSITNSDYSAILAGSANTINVNALNSVVLGMNNFSATSANTTYVKNAYVDGYFDLNPQSVLPTPKIGRMFFSGTPMFRVLVNTGGTANDWITL